MAWIEKKASGNYLVRWTEPNGGRSSKTARTRDEARAVKARVESELLTGSYVAQEARKRPFGEYARELLEGELNLEDSTRYQHLKLFGRWVEPYVANVPLGDFDTGTVRRLLAKVQAAGASPSLVGRVRNLVGKVLRRAYQEGILARNPVAAVPAPKAVRREIRVLTPEEVSAIADASDPRYRMVPLLSAWGTLRIGEVCALNEDAIDWEAGSIVVKRSVATAGGQTYLKGPKTAAGRRVVRLPSWVVAALREHVVRYRDSDGWLFRTPTGQLLSHVTYHRYWQAALKAAGFSKPWPVPHDLRHTAVSLMIRTGADPKQIQQRAGHATIKETYETYGHLFPGHDDALMEALEGYRPQEAKVVEL